MLFTLYIALTGCAGHGTKWPATAVPSVTPSTADKPVQQRKARYSKHERAAVAAANQVGVPYRYGGADQDGFDCSGLVYFSYRQVGKRLPRTTRSLWQALPRVQQTDLRAGDVLFFRIGGKVSHVGMYLGGRRFVHAPQSGRTVSIAKLDSPYYSKTFIGAGRP
ncbi:MAG: C40 family peptidase [Woeseia sp.]|nr:C40 family peptidase [Woeseia sp.]NNL54504.1 C40 family peptidase [Woeseia sp.]